MTDLRFALGLTISLLFFVRAEAVDLFYSPDALPPEVAQLDVPSQYSYSFVMSHCENWSMAFSELTRNGLTTTFQIAQKASAEEAINRWDRGGKGLQLEVLLDSTGYYKGLNACFGGDQNRKDFFTMTLIAGDLLGTSSAGALAVLAVVGPAKFLKALQKIRVLPKLNPKMAKYLAVGFWVATIGTSVGFILTQKYEAVQKHRAFLQRREVELSKIRERLTEVRSDLSQVQAIASDPNSSAEESDRARKIERDLSNIEHEYKIRVDEITRDIKPS